MIYVLYMRLKGYIENCEQHILVGLNYTLLALNPFCFEVLVIVTNIKDQRSCNFVLTWQIFIV